MLKEVQMPKLGQTVEEAAIETWHRNEGDTINKGEPLLDITTDKATLEVEAYVTGTVQKLLYAVGDVVPVNAVIAFVGDEAASDDLVAKTLADNARLAAAPAPAASAAPTPAPASAPAPASVAAPAPVALPAASGRLFASPRAKRVAKEQHVPLALLAGSGPNGRIVEANVLAYAAEVDKLRVSPTARVLAAERGVDLRPLKGSGVDGRIMKEDVEAAPAAPSVPTGQVVPLSAMRRVVAERLTYSKQTTPHFYLTTDVDMTALMGYRTQLNAAGGQKVSFNDLIMRALVLAFREVPQANVAWTDGGILYRGEINIGLAVALDEGLIVPVVHHCERKTVAEIAAASTDLVARARNKRLGPDDYEGGCFTISNVGMLGIDAVTPIINPGEVGILGVGRIAPKPVVIDNGIHIRQMSTFNLSIDHRIVDGAVGAQFFAAFKAALEAPETLG